MARVSIYYDKDEKEQFFMVRGDESYARSTTTLIEMGTRTERTSNFDVSVTVNVLRDRGSANIVIYDNDVPVYVIDDWDSSNNGTTIQLTNLNYDIEHIFYAEYMGNTQCRKSKSKTVSYTIPNTHRAETTLTIDNSITHSNPHNSLTKTITLTNNSSDERAGTYNYHQDIIVYYDDVLIGTYNTQSSNTISVTIPDVGDNGLHTIKAQYNGSQLLYSTINTLNISAGYYIVNNTPSDFIVFGETETVTGQLFDYFNQPHTPSTMDLQYYDEEGIGIRTVSAPVGSDEQYHFDINDAPSGDYKLLVMYNGENWISDMYSVPYIVPSQLEITGESSRMERDRLYIFKGETQRLTIKTNSTVKKVPIHITTTYSRRGEQTTQNVRTFSSGVAYFDLTGTGKEFRTIQADWGNLSASIRVGDYTQYWSKSFPRGVYNQSYYLSEGAVHNLNEYFKIIVPPASDYMHPSQVFFSLYDIANGTDYRWLFSGINTSAGVGISYISGAKTTANSMIMETGTVTDPTPSKRVGEYWVVEREDGVVTLSKNGNVVNTFDNQENYQPVFLFRNTSTSSVDINFYDLSLRGGVL